MSQRASIAMLCLLWRTGCSAQDVFLCPAFEYVALFHAGSPNAQGLNFGLRFPVGTASWQVEVRASLLNGSDVLDGESYRREDRRLGGSMGVIRSGEWGAHFMFDYGIETGFYKRSITIHQYSSFGTTEQSLITLGAQAALRMSRSRWVQPVVSIRPFYELPVQVHEPGGPGASYTGDQWGLSVCIGVLFGVAAQRSP